MEKVEYKKIYLKDIEAGSGAPTSWEGTLNRTLTKEALANWYDLYTQKITCFSRVEFMQCSQGSVQDSFSLNKRSAWSYSGLALGKSLILIGYLEDVWKTPRSWWLSRHHMWFSDPVLRPLSILLLVLWLLLTAHTHPCILESPLSGADPKGKKTYVHLTAHCSFNHNSLEPEIPHLFVKQANG